MGGGEGGDGAKCWGSVPERMRRRMQPITRLRRNRRRLCSLCLPVGGLGCGTGIDAKRRGRRESTMEVLTGGWCIGDDDASRSESETGGD